MGARRDVRLVPSVEPALLGRLTASDDAHDWPLSRANGVELARQLLASLPPLVAAELAHELLARPAVVRAESLQAQLMLEDGDGEPVSDELERHARQRAHSRLQGR